MAVFVLYGDFWGLSIKRSGIIFLEVLSSSRHFFQLSRMTSMLIKFHGGPTGLHKDMEGFIFFIQRTGEDK